MEEIRLTLIQALKDQMANGVSNVDTCEAGAIVDMIKDLAEAEYYLAMAKKTII